MICETEKRLLPGAACAVLFVHGILGSPAQFAPFLPLVPQDWSFCNLLLQGDVYKRQAFASAVAAAQTLRSTTRFSTVLSLLSGLLGLCLCALLLYWGSARCV